VGGKVASKSWEVVEVGRGGDGWAKKMNSVWGWACVPAALRVHAR